MIPPIRGKLEVTWHRPRAAMLICGAVLRDMELDGN